MDELTVPVRNKDHVQGPHDAPVTLVEYGDYECPYCGQAFLIVKKLQEELGDAFRLVFRHFPLSQIHPHALGAAYAAEAAGYQDKFWQMHDLLFLNQTNLGEEDLIHYAQRLNLDMDRFVADMESDKVQKRVKEDFWSGVQSGVNGTPTFFINGHRHDYWYDYDLLREAIDTTAGVLS